MSPEAACSDELLKLWLPMNSTIMGPAPVSTCAPRPSLYNLTADQLKERAVPPSRLSLLGLVRHMTEVERWWFRIHAGNTDMTFPYDPDETGQDFEALEDADAAANIEAFTSEIEVARAAVAAKQLDDVVPSHGDHPERTRDIRWIYLHMIEEYARHNGHADLIRERIDGVTGD